MGPFGVQGLQAAELLRFLGWNAPILRGGKIGLRLQFFFCSTIRGGCENYAVTIGRAAARAGWDLWGAFPERSATRSVVEELESAGGHYHPLEISEDGSTEGQSFQRHDERRLISLVELEATRPDVCLLAVPSIQYMSGTMVACAELGIPAVVCFQYVQNVFSFNEWRLKWYERARKARQKWVAVSDNNRQIMAESFQMDPEEITVIYNGSPTALGVPSDDEVKGIRERLRGELEIAKDATLLLTVGALRHQKGYDLLTSAIPAVLKKFPEARWVWAGDGPDAEDLNSLIHRHKVDDAVTMLGRRSDVPDLLRAADLFVFPTRFEGHPFALMEAMSAGLPAVTTDASGITEVVTHLEHAVVCPKEDPKALAEAMIFALSNPDRMRAMAEQGRRRVADFSEEKMIAETLELLGNAAGVQS